MKKVLMSFVCIGLLALTVGCRPQPPSKNVQNALLNAGGQVATAALLDRSSEPAERITKTKEIVAEVRKLVNEGEVGTWTLAQLQEQLNKVIPAEYQIYMAQVLAALQGLTLPTDKIGPDNVMRINEVLDGIDHRCDKYIIERGLKAQRAAVGPVVIKAIIR